MQMEEFGAKEHLLRTCAMESGSIGIETENKPSSFSTRASKFNQLLQQEQLRTTEIGSVPYGRFEDALEHTSRLDIPTFPELCPSTKDSSFDRWAARLSSDKLCAKLESEFSTFCERFPTHTLLKFQIPWPHPLVFSRVRKISEQKQFFHTLFDKMSRLRNAGTWLVSWDVPFLSVSGVHEETCAWIDYWRAAYPALFWGLHSCERLQKSKLSGPWDVFFFDALLNQDLLIELTLQQRLKLAFGVFSTSVDFGSARSHVEKLAEKSPHLLQDAALITPCCGLAGLREEDAAAVPAILKSFVRSTRSSARVLRPETNLSGQNGPKEH